MSVIQKHILYHRIIQFDFLLFNLFILKGVLDTFIFCWKFNPYTIIKWPFFNVLFSGTLVDYQI